MSDTLTAYLLGIGVGLFVAAAVFFAVWEVLVEQTEKEKP